MSLPDVVRSVAQCAPGKSVRVIGPDGTYRLLSSTENDQAPDDQVVLRLIELDAQLRATVGIVAALAANVNELAQRAADAMDSVKTVSDRVDAFQIRVSQSVERLADIVAQPMQPIYNAKGLLIGARRVEKL